MLLLLKILPVTSGAKLPDLDVVEGEEEEGEEVLPPPCVDLTNYPLKIGRPGSPSVIFKILWKLFCCFPYKQLWRIYIYLEFFFYLKGVWHEIVDFRFFS
jgi:hypothetical protein